MKKLNAPITVVAVILFGFTGCVKHLDEIPPDPAVPDSFQKIVVPESFKWATSNKVNFSFTGSAAGSTEMILKVLDPDGTTVFQKLQKANENYQGIIEVPAHFQSLIVNYGSISENIDCTTGTVSIKID
jgi:hypothetical protein